MGVDGPHKTAGHLQNTPKTRLPLVAAGSQSALYGATAMAGTTRPPYRFPDIDLQTPTSLSTQKQLSRALHRIVAADLMQDLCLQNRADSQCLGPSPSWP